MKDKENPPAPEESGDEALKRLEDLTKRIVSVRKDEIEKTKKHPKTKPA